MKNYLLPLLLLPLIIMGCNNDDEYRYVSLVTVAETDEGNLTFMRNDSVILNPDNYTIDYDAGQRMLIEYKIKESDKTVYPYVYTIKLKDYSPVLTKAVIDLTTENEDTVGDDAFWNIYDMNSSGGYLNVYVGFLYNNVAHTINLVANTITPPTNSADTINLELRQNANGENIGFPVRELVSFNIDEYLTSAQESGLSKLVLAVKVLLPSDVYSVYNVTFNIGSLNTEQTSYNSLSAFSTEENSIN